MLRELFFFLKELKYAGTIPQQTYTTTYYWQSVLCSFHCNFSPDKWSCITESRSFRYPQIWEVFCFVWVFFFAFCLVCSFDTKGIRYRSCPERLSIIWKIFIKVTWFCFIPQTCPWKNSWGDFKRSVHVKCVWIKRSTLSLYHVGTWWSVKSVHLHYASAPSVEAW